MSQLIIKPMSVLILGMLIGALFVLLLLATKVKDFLIDILSRESRSDS